MSDTRCAIIVTHRCQILISEEETVVMDGCGCARTEVVGNVNADCIILMNFENRWTANES